MLTPRGFPDDFTDSNPGSAARPLNSMKQPIFSDDDDELTFEDAAWDSTAAGATDRSRPWRSRPSTPSRASRSRTGSRTSTPTKQKAGASAEQAEMQVSEESNNRLRPTGESRRERLRRHGL